MYSLQSSKFSLIFDENQDRSVVSFPSWGHRSMSPGCPGRQNLDVIPSLRGVLANFKYVNFLCGLHLVLII